MPHINGIIVQSHGSQPWVKHIMHELATKVPRIEKLGGKVPRKNRMGGYSAHSTGRAIDIYLDANDDVDLKLGNELCELFKASAATFKIHDYIWNGCDWSRTNIAAVGECNVYAGNNDRRGPHKDHIHLAFENTDLKGKPNLFVEKVIIPIHEYMSTRDWEAPVEGWGSWDPENAALKTPVF